MRPKWPRGNSMKLGSLGVLNAWTGILSAKQQASTSLYDDTVQCVNLSNSRRGPGGSNIADMECGCLSYSKVEI